jgi:hypothetical protein
MLKIKREREASRKKAPVHRKKNIVLTNDQIELKNLKKLAPTRIRVF